MVSLDGLLIVSLRRCGYVKVFWKDGAFPQHVWDASLWLLIEYSLLFDYR